MALYSFVPAFAMISERSGFVSSLEASDFQPMVSERTTDYVLEGASGMAVIA